MSVHPLTRPRSEPDPLAEARVQLAAAHRPAAVHQSEKGADDDYPADTPAEGERLAGLLQGRPILFMKNHGLHVQRAPAAPPTPSHLFHREIR